MVVARSEILKDLNQLKYFLAVFLAIFVMAAVLLAYFITKAMYKPLKCLTDTMKEVSGGELIKGLKLTQMMKSEHCPAILTACWIISMN